MHDSKYTAITIYKVDSENFNPSRSEKLPLDESSGVSQSKIIRVEFDPKGVKCDSID